MQIRVTNYAFSASNKTVTFNDYVSGGINLEGVALIINVTREKIIFNPTKTGYGGSSSGNILTLHFDTSAAGHQNTDKLAILYNDPNANQNINLATALKDIYDSIIANPRGTTPHASLTASGVVSSIGCKLVGIFVNSTSSGSINIWDNATTNSGVKLVDGFIPPAIGFYNLGNMNAVNGIYLEKTAGTINANILTLPADQA